MENPETKNGHVMVCAISNNYSVYYSSLSSIQECFSSLNREHRKDKNHTHRGYQIRVSKTGALATRRWQI